MLEFQEIIKLSEKMKIQSRRTKEAIEKFPKAYQKV